ncbi:unnamed protein product, partial [Tetraodon nigroviridis]
MTPYKRIINSLELLSGLDQDAIDVPRGYQHPQAEMIEQDMKQLRDRVMKLREEYDQIYNLTRTEGKPSFNWGFMIDEKLDNLNNKGFGQDLPTVENEVEEHNIFHSEVEALAPHITASGDKEYVSGLQMSYNKLLANSTARQRNLTTLRDYMQSCTNELYWMDQQAEERINYDWSNTNLDYSARQKQYENFISKCLEPKEATVTKLNEDGEKLIAAEHPGKNVIEAHMEAVHADWKEYLNLLICEENHLKHMDEYHKLISMAMFVFTQFHKEARDTQDLLKRLEKELDQKYNPEFKDVYQMEGLIMEIDDQAKAMEHIDDRIKALQKRSLQVLPLHYRRETPPKLLPVEALCEYDTDEGQIVRGERYTLLQNKGTKWEVKDGAGRKLTAPGICFMIPPTDPEGVAIADSLASQQNGIKQKMGSSKKVLLKRFDELKKSGTGTDKQEQQCRQMMAGLDKVVNDLDKQEKAIYTRVRPPLEQNRPVHDSADRLQDLRVIIFISRLFWPNYQLRTLLFSFRIKNSNQLETSLQNGKTLLAGFENRLAREEVAPADITSLEKQQRELGDIASDLRSKRSIVAETEQNLRSAKISCDSMATKFQEHCPDIERQEVDVQKLNKRVNNVQKQIDSRSQSLQRAKMAYKNYHNDYDNLNNWLSHVPNYEPRETDDARQVETKLRNQRNLLSDISKKEADLNNISKHSQLYQQAIKDYENETEKFRALLDLEDGVPTQTYKRSRMESPAMTVKAEEAAIGAKFTEVKSMNKQKLQNLEYAQSVLNQQPVIPVQSTNVQLVQSALPGEEPWRIKKKLEDEIRRREQLERELEIIQTDIYVLEGQKPQDTIVKKELIKKVPDPQLDEEMHKVQQKLSEERRSNHVLENDLEVLKLKLHGLETEIKEGAQQYITKEVVNEVLQYREDPKTKEEIEILKKKLLDEQKKRLDLERERAEQEEKIRLKKMDLSQVREKIVQQEVVKMEEDPVLRSECDTFLRNIGSEQKQKESLKTEMYELQKKKNDMDLQLEELERERRSRRESEMEIQRLRVRLNELEIRDKENREKVTVKQKVVLQQDPQQEKEHSILKLQLEEEKHKRSLLEKEWNALIQQHHRLQNDIRRLRSEIEITSNETRLITETAPKDDGKNLDLRLDSLQRELADLRSVTVQKDDEIERLQKNLNSVRMKKEQRESHLSRSIVVIDPDTGKEMRPEEAYKLGLIDWKMFVNLQSQECDWEEITVKGPKGESSILHDRKSGKKFSIDDALRLGYITNQQLQQYINKEISIQEFGVMVSGRK